MTDVERFKLIVKDMTELFAKKNANYGNSFEKLYRELGPISGLVPLHNKLDRLTNLIKGGRNDFESVEDTLIDLANYSIMNLIEIQKEKEQNAPKKVKPQKQILNEEIPVKTETKIDVTPKVVTEKIAKPKVKKAEITKAADDSEIIESLKAVYNDDIDRLAVENVEEYAEEGVDYRW